MVLLAPVFAALCLSADPLEIRQSFESLPPGAEHVRLIDDGARGHAVSFDNPEARIDLGPCPLGSDKPFTIRLAIRTHEAGFSTALMARDGEAVGASIIMGRVPGHVSFEAWSWGSIRLISTSRIDDGAWHRVLVEYEPKSNTAVLTLDGRTEACATLGAGRSPTAALRLGNNIGAHQPFRGDLDELEITPTVTNPERFAALAPITPAEDKARDLANLRASILAPHAATPTAAAAWATRREVVRREVAQCLGLSPLPERRPLDPESHGSLVGGGVRVERMSWSSWPGYRATGWLWTADPAPADAPPPPQRRPAMLMPHGHWANGAIEGVVQVRAARFARAGYIVLVPDSVHVEDLASGVNSVGAMTWDNIRAIDLLAARPDVDPTRVGCTGASGGAQQTMYLMAIEDRLAAAAPVCMICQYQEILAERSAHCGCNHVPGIGAATDQPEMCAVFSPRPALFITATGDWTHAFPTQGWPQIRSVYEFAGAGAAAREKQFNAGHGYDGAMRATAYAFFDPLLSPPNPSATEDGFIPFSLEKLSRLGPPNRAPERQVLADEHVARIAKVHSIRELAPGLSWTIQPAKPVALGPAGEGSAWSRFTIAGPDHVAIPFLSHGIDWNQVGDPASAPDILVLIPATGRAPLLLNPPAWLAESKRTIIIEPRFRGEWSEFTDAWRRNAILLGRGEGYQAAIDIAQVIQSLPGKGRVSVLALGPTGVEALLALESSPRIGRLIIEDLGPAFATDGNRDPQCPGILHFGDLDALVANARPRCDLTIGGSALGKSAQPLTAAQIGGALHNDH